MEPPRGMQIKLSIGYALGDRLAPVACAIVKSITTSTKMIDDLPSAAIEAMLDYSKEQRRLDRPRTALERAYKDLRQPLITYGEVALREARTREHHLLEGITGRHADVLRNEEAEPQLSQGLPIRLPITLGTL
jgi:hypothetical protein